MGKVSYSALLNCGIQGVILIVGIMLVGNMSDINKVASQNSETVTAIIDDWKKVPFNSIYVTDDKCPAGTETVFTRKWGGIKEGCYVKKKGTWGDYRSFQILTTAEYKTYRDSNKKSSDGKYISTNTALNPYHEDEKCEKISMKPAKIQDEFFDMRFCGKRSGTSFANAIRPVKTGTSWACPTGTVACS